MSSVWPAPAKLNLFLHVIGRRADGYHELQTVFQFIDLCDELDFELREDGRIRRLSETPDVPEEQDLVVRAARSLQQACGCTLGVNIRLRKRVPMGGGLGGGSSDAATTLVALNRLWGAGLDAGALGTLGLALGADVPIFVHGRAAWAEGVGERFTPVDLDAPWYLVIRPPCSVPTGAVFAAPELTRDTPPITIRGFRSGAGRNDCEAVVRARYPEVAKALDWLGRRAPARLTGTGSCVFAAFGSEASARQALSELPAGWTGFVARGLNRSPLLDRLEREPMAGQRHSAGR